MSSSTVGCQDTTCHSPLPTAHTPGDLVDRGSWSVEVALTAFAYKWLYPERVFINRGNHETNGELRVPSAWRASRSCRPERWLRKRKEG
jgi:hypothetical protein